MSDVEVVERGVSGSVVLEHGTPDPLAGAEVVSTVTDVEVVEHRAPAPVVLEHTVPDPLAGAEVVSVGRGAVPEGAIGPAGGVLAGYFPDPDFAQPMATAAHLNAHEQAPTPHPAYDDMVSLRLLFENGLV